jgi:RsiW-degrading membrane proteinase PrsW (M82 family)/phage FluMu protein Com
MSIRICCTHCGKALKAPDGLAGKSAPCPNCKELVQVPMIVESSTDVAPVAAAPSITTPVTVAPTSSIYDLQSPPSPSPSPSPVFQPAAVRPSQPEPAAEPPTPARGRFFYCFFAVTLLPLALSLMGAANDVEQRMVKTLKIHPELEQQLDESELLTKDAFLSKLPGGRIDGAHLSYNSWVHWLYALLATAGFFGGIWLLFIPGNASPKQILTVGLATATFGIVFLLGVQWIAAVTRGFIMTGASIITVFFYIVKFIGFSYSAAMDPNSGFWLSFLGFTFGVGLCEELTKALPVIFSIRGGSKLDWRGACMWGLASGVGFGVAEGIMYSSDYYNGLETAGAYLVRFVSCVGLHGVWGASVGIMAWRRREWLQRDSEWGDLMASLLYILAIPMTLHGLYDTMLKKDMNGAALLVALASFAWLVVLTEGTRIAAPRRRATT